MSGDRPTPGLKPATRLARAGRARRFTQGVVNPPVYHASTCTFETLAEFDARRADPDSGLFYGRRGTPTLWALEEALTSLQEQAEGTRLFPSGVAAIAGAFLSVVRPGDHVLLADSVYEPTRAMAKGLLERLGAEPEYYDPRIGGDVAALFRKNTRAVYMESPGSLTFEVQDVPAICAAAQDAGITTIADNTWASPLLFPALDRGVDIEIQSLTKFVVGHSDVLMGSLTARKSHWPRVKAMALRLGQTVGPDDAYLTLRGLRTLDSRLKRHGESALHIARELARHSAVARVLCPGLDGDPGHELWQRDFAGYSSLFSIELAGGSRSDLAAMVDRLELFSMGFSFGGYESLVLPVDPGELRTATEFRAAGPILRIHIGMEDPGDLLEDLIAGLDRFARQAGLAT
ncbi:MULTISPECIES: cystathionine beta-lyase [Pacificimonas]|uniref:cystathionine beta-lyase n=1 Tax=Pacificimonas TaxID=1960290 RepID=UPI001CCB6F1B|nr:MULTISPECIES: cystathionine beta-lyase [Pacificimonas]